ncbi:MAG: dTDP-4-dehydrorhamnose reductase [Candidatus Omnitrophota bacterium]
MKILITGAAGMLGRVLCGVLAKDCSLFGLGLRRRADKCRFYRCDIADYSRLRQTIEAASPQVIIHAAAWTDVDGCELNPAKSAAVNFRGTVNVARVARALGSSLFFISTDYVFSGRKKAPYNEKDRAYPLNVYGRDKLRAERFIRKNLQHYFIVRSSWLYGPGGNNFVDKISRAMKNKPRLKVVGDQIGAPTYVYDLAGGIRRLVFSAQHAPRRYRGIYHITNRGGCSWYELARAVARLRKISCLVVAARSQDLSRPARRPANSLLDNTKFNRLAHKPLRHWKAALRDYVQP